MDLNSIKNQVSNLTLYDLKASVRKVQNAVMNYTEMESKVREATNNEPWGASSSLMQEIASGTHSFHLLSEIMPMIYKRFTEKTAEEWRQIYKALQLLEFLVKNGSERVIDDARSHLSLLKMLRQFHYIDQNGKDQGINVRNRSKELAELLSDVERIRAERKKARANRNKFGGVEGGASSSSGGRYGGFGSESSSGYGGYSGGVYGDGGGFGGQSSEYEESSARKDQFDDYDEYDEGGTTTVRRNAPPAVRKPAPPKVEPVKPKEPEVDFLSFDNDIPPAAPPKEVPPAVSVPSLSSGLTALSTADDEFDDFESAPSVPGTNPSMSSASAPPGAKQASSEMASFKPQTNISTAPNYNIDMSAPLQTFTSPPTQASSQSSMPKPTGYQASTPNYFTSVQAPTAPAASPSSTSNPSTARPGLSSNLSTASAPAAAKGNDAFGSLWSTASTNAGIKKSAAQNGTGPNLASLQQQKASQGIWGQNAVPSSLPLASTKSNGNHGGNGLDDLLG